MRIKVEEEEQREDIEIIIRCPRMDDTVKEVLARLEIIDKRIIGIYRGENYVLEVDDILYIETIDKRSFIYTKECSYETIFKLYELEERLIDMDFFRVGKSLIINFQKIKTLKPDLDGRILVTMQNGEKRLVSRQYAVSIKKRLGVLK